MKCVVQWYLSGFYKKPKVNICFHYFHLLFCLWFNGLFNLILQEIFNTICSKAFSSPKYKFALNKTINMYISQCPYVACDSCQEILEI